MGAVRLRLGVVTGNLYPSGGRRLGPQKSLSETESEQRSACRSGDRDGRTIAHRAGLLYDRRSRPSAQHAHARLSASFLSSTHGHTAPLRRLYDLFPARACLFALH